MILHKRWGMVIRVNIERIIMRYTAILLIVILCIGASLRPVYAHSIEDAIKTSNPAALRHVLISGFTIHSDEKKRYLALAHDITNKTYADLHQNSIADVGRFIRGSLKMVGGAAALYTGYQFYKGYWDRATYVEQDHGGLGLAEYQIEDPQARGAVYVLLGFVSSYLGYKGLEDWGGILSKRYRFAKHCSALAVEAIVQRLPAESRDI